MMNLFAQIVCANVNVFLSFAVARIGRLLDTGLVVLLHFDGPSHVSEVVVKSS